MFGPMRDLRFLLYVAFVGCGATASSPVVDAPDVPADASPDARGARCDLAKPFGAPTLVASLNGTGRDLHAMIADDLTLYMTSDRRGTMDLFTATRGSSDAPWSTPSPLAGFSTNDTELSPFVTADGLTMVYGYAPQGQLNSDIYIATRSAQSVGFSPGTPVAAVNSAFDDADTVLTADGALLYFDSSRPGTGGYDLYVAARLPTGEYGAPQPVSELNTTAYDAHPRITADGLRIYYSSMRTDGGAPGGADIWTAAREARSMPFGTPTLVGELSTTSNESPTWISPDGCRLLFQSNRAGGPGAQDIWEVVKPL
jgi:Tol biopolymer transport system component